MWKRLVLGACAALLAAGCPMAWSVASAAVQPGPVVSPALQPGSFTFGAAGDFGANSNTSAVLNAVAGAGTDFFDAVGDLSYNQVTPESAWCNFVTSRVGSTYPFELLSGNHEDDGPHGQITNFAACLPDRLGNVTGSYGKEYYFDYPASSPLARVINISPNLTFPGGATYQYTVGSAHYTWLSNAIDSARAAGVPWVIVGMHENCLKAGSSACEIGTDLENLLVAKKVDLILQGHTHTYQRSKQLALSAACPSVTNTAYDPDCVVNNGSTGIYTKGAGLVQVISGTGGESTGSVSTSDPDSQYFAKLNGTSYGFTKFTVSATQLSAQFVAASGSNSDSFTIGAPSGDQPPTAVGAALATPAGSPLPVTLQASDPDDCELAFSVVTQPAHGTLSAPLTNQDCATGTPDHDSATATYAPDSGFNGTDSFTFKANDGTSDSNTATVTVTVGTPPPGITFRSASSAQNPTATSLTINRPAGVVAGDVMVAGVGIRGAPVVTAPAGWTRIRTDAAGTSTTQAIYDRVATPSEPASYTWSFSKSVPAAGGISDYQGVNNAAPVNVSAGAGQNSNTTAIVAPSVTTTVAGAEVVGFFSVGGANSITPPTGMTERGEASSTAGSSRVTWEGSDFTQAAPGATGTRTATATVAHENVGALVALTPGVAPANQAPTAAAASATTAQDSAVVVTLPASDPDNCELAFSVETQPAHGTLSAPSNQACVAGSPDDDSATVIYTPATGFTGTDSFTFKANDGTADSNTATATVTVTPPPAGITFRSASSAQNPTGATLSISRPAGVAPGDVMVAGVGIRGAPTVTPPAGWTLIRRDQAGTYTTQALYYRVVTTVEPASYIWSFSQPVPAAGGIAAYQGVNTSGPVNVSGALAQNSDTTSIVAPSVTSTVAGGEVIGFFSIGGGNSITPPAGMTEWGEASSTAGASHVTWEGSGSTQATAGATGTRTATASSSPHPNVGAVVVLTPA
jgi:hypothetical protein